jgi:hypothetical protein
MGSAAGQVTGSADKQSFGLGVVLHEPAGVACQHRRLSGTALAGHCCVRRDRLGAARAPLRWPRQRSSSDTAGMRTHPPPAPAPQSAFAGFRFPPDMVVLAVRWYLRFGLSYRDVEELLTERGVEVDHVTLYRWVLRFTPLLAEAARPCRHAVGGRWSVDET